MSRRNNLLDALGGDDELIGVNRREIGDALSELSSSRNRTRVSRNLDRRISSQIFNVLFGLLLLCGILAVVFVFGYRYLLGGNPQLSSISVLTEGKVNKNKILSFFSKKPPQGKLLDYVLPKRGNYYVQVALCKYQKCSQNYSSYLKRLGYEPQIFRTQVSIGGGYNEIVSKQSLSLKKAQDLADFINAVNDRSGYASVIPAGNGKFKISLGTFPNKELAEDFRRYYESLTVADQLRFVFSQTTSIQGSGLVKIVAGPFSNKEKVLAALTSIKQERILSDSFIITK